MRKEPYSVGSYVHVFNRGTRKMNIVRDEDDRWRFLKLVRYLNDTNVPRNWERDIGPDHIREGFARPKHWDEPDPYVSILSFCLMDNHFHFLFRENRDHGVSRFMHRLCTSMALYFNAKYEEEGTLFEGPYQARTIDTDSQLQYVATYISVKNTLELYPGGLGKALDEYETAFQWGKEYPFSSLAAQADELNSIVLDKKAMDDVLIRGSEFKKYAKDMLLGRRLPDDWARLTIDDY